MYLILTLSRSTDIFSFRNRTRIRSILSLKGNSNFDIVEVLELTSGTQVGLKNNLLM